MFSPDVWTFAVVGTLALLSGFFPTLMEARMRGGGIIGVVVLVWLLIGVFAAWQRDYFKGGDTSCASAGTIALTVVVGPLNYAGVNPKVGDCHMRLPQPSSMPAIGIERLIGMESS
jgi:membrane-bound ClpP family serine protease